MSLRARRHSPGLAPTLDVTPRSTPLARRQYATVPVSTKSRSPHGVSPSAQVPLPTHRDILPPACGSFEYAGPGLNECGSAEGPWGCGWGPRGLRADRSRLRARGAAVVHAAPEEMAPWLPLFETTDIIRKKRNRVLCDRTCLRRKRTKRSNATESDQRGCHVVRGSPSSSG
jgi:hypothetical protein